MVINSDYIYTRTKASAVINVSGFITFRIFGFEGICMAGVFGFYPFTLHRWIWRQMCAWLPSTLFMCWGKNADLNSTQNVNWTNNKVELLLGVVLSYLLQKDHEGLEWESIKSKYKDVQWFCGEMCRKERRTVSTQCQTLYLRNNCKQNQRLEKKYKAVDSGRRLEVGELWRPFMICAMRFGVGVLQLYQPTCRARFGFCRLSSCFCYQWYVGD